MADAASTGGPAAAAPASTSDRDAVLVEHLEQMLAASRAQQRHLRVSILRVLEYLEHPSTR